MIEDQNLSPRTSAPNIATGHGWRVRNGTSRARTISGPERRLRWDDVPADFQAASGAETFPPDDLEFRPDLSSLDASRD
jgi:hypothetical protein